MLPVLQLGPFALQVPGMVLLASIWLGLQLSESRADKRQVNSENIGNLVLVTLLAALLGARIGYALRFPQAFLEHPSGLISLNPGLLDPWAASAAALLGALVFAQRKDMSLWPSLDALSPLFASLSLGLALSSAASGQGYGAPAQLPWAIQLWGASRHPSQIYEALAAVLILLVVLRRGKKEAAPGVLFMDLVIYSAGARLLLEAFRAESHLLPNGWRIEQMLAWLILAAALWARHQRLRVAS
jgi:prolipoprotein diacylglyceryltransferase